MAATKDQKVPKDPNMMTSTMFSLVRMHWYVSIKVVALYIVLYFITFSFSTGTTIQIVRTVITCLAWVFFDYSDTYSKAMRDVNIVKYGYLEYDKLRGLKSGLLAQIPGLVVVFLIWLTRGTVEYSDAFRMAYFVLYSAPIQIVTVLEDSVSYLALLLPLIVVPITSTIGYYCGYNGMAGGMMNRFVYRNRKKR